MELLNKDSPAPDQIGAWISQHGAWWSQAVNGFRRRSAQGSEVAPVRSAPPGAASVRARRAHIEEIPLTEESFSCALQSSTFAQLAPMRELWTSDGQVTFELDVGEAAFVGDHGIGALRTCGDASCLTLVGAARTRQGVVLRVGMAHLHAVTPPALLTSFLQRLRAVGHSVELSLVTGHPDLGRRVVEAVRDSRSWFGFAQISPGHDRMDCLAVDCDGALYYERTLRDSLTRPVSLDRLPAIGTRGVGHREVRVVDEGDLAFARRRHHPRVRDLYTVGDTRSIVVICTQRSQEGVPCTVAMAHWSDLTPANDIARAFRLLEEERSGGRFTDVTVIEGRDHSGKALLVMHKANALDPRMRRLVCSEPVFGICVDHLGGAFRGPL